METLNAVEFTSTFSRRPAYRYLRKTDKIPTYDELDDMDPMCLVKLFLPEGRWTFYVTAATLYGGALYGGEQIILTGWCVSALGPDCDEYGDSSMDEIAAVRTRFGLPVERDLHWTPTRLSEVRG